MTAALVDGAPDTVSLVATALPPNATYDASTGVLTFAPDYAQAGEVTIVIEALQREQVVQTEAVTITVTETPVFALSPGSNNEVGEGATLTVTVVLDDPSRDSISLTADGLPPNATFDASTGVLTFAPDYAQAGEVTISIDGLQRGQVVQTEVVTIAVAETPVFALSPGSNNEVEEGATLTVTAVLDDPSRASVSLTADGLPPNATFDAAAGRLTFAPDYSQAGDYAVTIVASERDQDVQTADVTITVTETPVFALTPVDVQRIAEGQSATTLAEVIVSAVGDVVLSALGLPANATFDVASGGLLFSPDYAQAGDYELTVVATQNGVRVGSLSAAVTVVNVPTFVLSPEGDAALDEGDEMTVQLVAIDAVGDDVSFAAEDLPRNATYADGTLNFTPDFSQQGTHTVTFRAVQDGQTVDSESVTFTVRNVDVLALTPDAPYTVDEGSTVSISVVIAPQAAGEVTVSAADLPPNAEFDASRGVLTFVPDHSQAGQHSMTIRASQDGVPVEEERLTVTVVDVNVAPTVTLSRAPATAAGDIRITYDVTDFDGDPVSLEVEYNDGAWASASVDESVVDTTNYSGALVWRSRDDIPSTGGVDVRLRVTPSDAGQGDAVTTDAIRLVNLLGDYNDDLVVGFDDLVDFTQAWRTQDASRDIGPATGDTPDLAPRLDGVIDFEDLTTFVRMWNWSADQALLAVGAAMAPAALSNALAYRVRLSEGDWSVQHVDIVDPFDTGSAAARLTISYDPESVAIRVRAERDPSAVLLTRLDATKGVLEVQMAWLDSRSGPDAMFGLDVTALRPGDTEARVAFDIRDSAGRPHRGMDVIRLRFEPPPTTTQLLPNYPNPFNPETWIPFELSEDTDVVVTIYDLEGALIRTLRLGENTVGRYRGRDRAAYWDGANEQGESVASGVYVYELRAGDYREMRRMVIRK